MIQDKLNELEKLIDQDPTSPQMLDIAAEIKSTCNTTEKEKFVEDFVGARLPKLTADIDYLHEQAIKLQLEEIADMLNLSYIAKNYFKKSRAWLSQRINGNCVNGKPCRFSPSELETFNAALLDMSLRLANVSIKY